MAKKDIYKGYGIDYKDGKILTPFGTWINPLLPIGSNSKVGTAATWSIYHGNETLSIDSFGQKTKAVMESANIREIVASCPCHCKGCYCDSGRYCFDSNKASNMLKLIIARYYGDFMRRAIIAQIKADKITQVRIHASGDFFSVEYVDDWKAIITACGDVTFWTYTKYEYAVKAFDGIRNISVVPSITPIGFNFGTCADLLKMHRKLANMGYRVHVCACGTPFERHCADCVTGCKAIGKNCDFVLFIKHSTPDYKAGKQDPNEYRELCELIARQDN